MPYLLGLLCEFKVGPSSLDAPLDLAPQFLHALRRHLERGPVLASGFLIPGAGNEKTNHVGSTPLTMQLHEKYQSIPTRWPPNSGCGQC